MTSTKPMMPFPEAIKSCLRQYVGFRGRATRAEYWWWALGTTVVSMLLSIIDGVLSGSGMTFRYSRPCSGWRFCCRGWR